jgi:hypothetical protein
VVSLFSQKIKQGGSVLLAILKRGAAEQEVIYILEEFTWGKMEGKEVPSQSLAREVMTLLEPMRQDSPSHCWEIWVSGSVQVKAKRFWDFRWTGIVKKVSFRSRTVKWVVVPGMRDWRV